MTGAVVAKDRTVSLARDLVMLTKPRIISLLLVTTIEPPPYDPATTTIWTAAL